MAEQVGAGPLVPIENRLCPGCKQSAVNESGGLVVAFGQSFFHVDCFKCAKCNNQVTADTNLLLLSDGSPICAECSYNCNVCHQPILDEAIMTGDDSYHAHCFKCKVCRNRIDELVFAKTSHGIYCMTCHNDRMAKIRRHAQRKREKEKAAAGSASSSTRDREAREVLGENSAPDRPHGLSPPGSLRSKASASGFRDTPSMRSLNISTREAPSTSARHPRSSSPIDDVVPAAKGDFSPVTVATDGQRDTSRQSDSSHSSGHSQAFQLTVAPPDTSHHDIEVPTHLNGDAHSGGPTLVNGHGQGDSPIMQSAPAGANGGSHLTPNSAAGGVGLLQRRKSYDDGTRPLNVLFGKKGADQDKKDGVDKPASGGLSVPGLPSRPDAKRRSINHALTLDYKNAPPSSFHTMPSEMVRSQTLPVRADSPVAPSPSRAVFDVSLPRRGSNASLLRDNSSGSTIYHSPSTSPAPPETGRATPDSGRMRSTSHDAYSAVPQTAPPLIRPTTPSRLVPRPIVTLERPPQRSDSLGNIASVSEGHGTYNVDGRLSPVGPGFRQPLRLDGLRSGRSSPMGWNGDRSGMMTPTSPSHRADVPHGVESGTDTEADSNGRKSDDDVVSPTSPPPRPPPKESRLQALGEGLKLDIDTDVSAISHLDGSDESSPVERTSIATFIAPALPPIRFSMSGADFSDFLKSVGGIPSLKSLDEIAQADEPEQKSPRSVNTLLPQSDIEKPPSDTKDESAPGDANPSSESISIAHDTEASDTVPQLTTQFASRGRAASESQSPYGQSASKRERFDSNASLNIVPSTARITVTSPTGSSASPPVTNETNELVVRRLQEALADANARGSQQLKFDKGFVEAILTSLEQRSKEFVELREKYLGTKRASEQYITGLTVAQQEYDRELVARRNAEAEVIRLRVLLSGQAAKLTALSGETNRREARRQLTEDLSKNLDQLERDVSKLKAERDVTLAEVEELCSSKSMPNNSTSGEVSAAQLSRSLTMRLDNIKKQYQHELIPLTRQRDTLIREIAELRATREQFLEETTVLNARNEELAQLSAQYARRMEAARAETPTLEVASLSKEEPALHENKKVSFDRVRPILDLPPPVQPSTSTGSTPSTSTLVEDREIKVIRVPKPEFTDAMSTLKHGIFKWPGYRMRDQTTKGKGNVEHNFQPASAIRFTRCDHCGEKLWGGSHFRCTTCHINVHSRCVQQVSVACSQHDVNGIVQPPPSIFGRDLVEQVKSDLRWGDRKVPVIVEKCIEAVETLALDFEGIYRKTGGSGQTKMITQLFERGDYTSFDLTDTDRFNDICSVTSVLKTYFRSLPVPLLTFDLHEEFIAAAGLKDPALKTKQLQELVDRLPSEHYHTLRLLVLHLHRVREHSDANLMNARNLGVVFGPTLMWSRDPGSEFSDMAGKALMVEWLVENATSIFQL